jgi:hypothetical protein
VGVAVAVGSAAVTRERAGVGDARSSAGSCVKRVGDAFPLGAEEEEELVARGVRVRVAVPDGRIVGLAVGVRDGIGGTVAAGASGVSVLTGRIVAVRLGVAVGDCVAVGDGVAPGVVARETTEVRTAAGEHAMRTNSANGARKRSI